MDTKFLTGLGLSEDVAKKVFEQHGKDINAIKLERDNYEKDKDTFKTQLDDAKIALKAFEGVDVTDLQGKITQLNKDLAAKETAHNTQMHQMKVDAAVDSALVSAKAINAKAVKPFLTDLDKAEFDDKGNVKGLDEQLSKLLKGEETEFLFAGENKQQFKGATPGETGKESEDGKVDVTKMTYDELVEYYTENPDAPVVKRNF